ncbi:hypothetical protein [Chryseobacterium sp. M5A1_1a]
MGLPRIIVKTESSDLWWGIYGFTKKTGWEDIELFYASGERIGFVCLNTKTYLRHALESLKDEVDEKDFREALQNYLEDNICHYWLYYDKKESEHFHEVSYDAPKNEEGVKPCFIDIWHPHDGINIQTIENAVSEFAEKFLNIENCIVEVEHDVTLEESFISFKENEERFGRNTTTDIVFSEELVAKLSDLWKINNDQVLKKLKESI